MSLTARDRRTHPSEARRVCGIWQASLRHCYLLSEQRVERIVKSEESSELGSLVPGAQLKVRRSFGYAHHGVYVGHGEVVQFGGRVMDKQRANVDIVDLESFAAGGRIQVVENRWMVNRAEGAPTSDESVARARWLVAHHPPANYNVLGRNCESIANWCTTGYTSSAQALGVYSLFLMAATIIMVVGMLQSLGVLPQWLPRWLSKIIVPLIAFRLAVAFSRDFSTFRFERLIETYPQPLYRSRTTDFAAYADHVLGRLAAMNDGLQPRPYLERSSKSREKPTLAP